MSSLVEVGVDFRRKGVCVCVCVSTFKTLAGTGTNMTAGRLVRPWRGCLGSDSAAAVANILGLEWKHWFQTGVWNQPSYTWVGVWRAPHASPGGGEDDPGFLRFLPHCDVSLTVWDAGEWGPAAVFSSRRMLRGTESRLTDFAAHSPKISKAV